MAVESELSALTVLRDGVEFDAIDQATQIFYESWVKREAWRVRTEALPLAVGVDPSQWEAHLARVDGSSAATALGADLATYCGVEIARDDDVSPGQVRQWMRAMNASLPISLARLLDFIGVTLPQSAPGSLATRAEQRILEERCTMLGAALSLITKTPAQCLDSDGYFDCVRIARLIFAQAVYWFPLEPPELSETDVVDLLRQWVASPMLA
jgi:hypothetical protein